jgi:hypothetical protein
MYQERLGPVFSRRLKVFILAHGAYGAFAPVRGRDLARRGVEMRLLDKAKSLLSQNKDKAKDAVDKGGDVVDEKTGGKYEGKVDTVQEKAKDYIDKDDQ